MDLIQHDFDRIALLSPEGWSDNSHHHEFLLRYVPSPCSEALEIGCGTGAFSRRLAERAGQVIALDFSPQMIRLARERSPSFPNIDFQIADALSWVFPLERFDCVASIATLHHLPLRQMLLKMAQALRPGGSLIVLDLFREEGLGDAVAGIASIPLYVALRLLKTGRLREPRALREAWAAHGQHDVYPSLSEVRRACAEVLPGAVVRRRLLWRCAILWRKGSVPPAAEQPPP